jgi:hypothetical protein
MVGLTTLWLPIVVSAVVVFIASSLIHMVVKWHNTDWHRLPDEKSLRDDLAAQGVQPGMYNFPRPEDPSKVGSPEHMEQWKEGPVGMLITVPNDPGMGKGLLLWFVYTLGVSFMVAYLTGRTNPVGAEYLAVFRVAGVTAILAYAAAYVPRSIWYGYSWGSTIKEVVDGVVYGLLTAGVFGWLWPS